MFNHKSITKLFTFNRPKYFSQLKRKEKSWRLEKALNSRKLISLKLRNFRAIFFNSVPNSFILSSKIHRFLLIFGSALVRLFVSSLFLSLRRFSFPFLMNKSDFRMNDPSKVLNLDSLMIESNLVMDSTSTSDCKGEKSELAVSAGDMERGGKKLVIINFDDVASNDWRKLFVTDPD